MKEGIGYTVTINIISTFIVIIFAFLSGILIYFKSNKVSNAITNAIDKYEGYNKSAEEEIIKKISSLGYTDKSITCADHMDDCVLFDGIIENAEGVSVGTQFQDGSKGYCVYYCDDSNGYYHYKIRTNLLISVPIIGNMIDFPLISNTNVMYNFSKD